MIKMNSFLKKPIERKTYMGRMSKIMMWIAGAIILMVFIKYPIHPAEQTLENWSPPLSGKVIVIDPGHGGPDGGAQTKNKIFEKDIALEVSIGLRDLLQQSGAIVHMTRETDTDLASEHTKGLSNRKVEDLGNRLQFINDHDPEFFVSIHLNSIPSPKWRGAQTFYHPKKDESKHLAKMIQSEVIRNLENTTRSALALNNMYLLKNAEVPGSLIEIGFLSNEAEREQLQQEKYQRQMAGSIYQGILRYMTEDIDNDDND